jgi:hypothetical protein
MLPSRVNEGISFDGSSIRGFVDAIALRPRPYEFHLYYDA